MAEAAARLVGAYGLAFRADAEPGTIIACRKDSPIVVGCGETGSYVASDIIAMIDATRDVVVLADGQMARLRPDGIEYYDEAGNPIKPDVTHVDWDLDVAEKEMCIRDSPSQRANKRATPHCDSLRVAEALPTEVVPREPSPVLGFLVSRKRPQAGRKKALFCWLEKKGCLLYTSRCV